MPWRPVLGLLAVVRSLALFCGSHLVACLCISASREAISLTEPGPMLCSLLSRRPAGHPLMASTQPRPEVIRHPHVPGPACAWPTRTWPCTHLAHTHLAHTPGPAHAWARTPRWRLRLVVAWTVSRWVSKASGSPEDSESEQGGWRPPSILARAPQQFPEFANAALETAGVRVSCWANVRLCGPHPELRSSSTPGRARPRG